MTYKENLWDIDIVYYTIQSITAFPPKVNQNLWSMRPFLFTCFSKKLPPFFTKYQFRFHILPLYYVMYSGGTRERTEWVTNFFIFYFLHFFKTFRTGSIAGRCFPTAFTRSRKSETVRFFRYYPYFLPHCPLPGAASPAVRQTKNDRLCVTISFVVQRCF